MILNWPKNCLGTGIPDTLATFLRGTGFEPSTPALYVHTFATMRIEKVMKKLFFWQRFAVALGLLAVFGIAYAADTNGRIKGTASDPSGAVVAGAKITATNIATGVTFQTVTGSDGVYLFPQLPVGTYSVSANASGFKRYDATGIMLNIDQEYVQDIHFAVGAASDVVQVNASGVQVDTTDMQLSNIVNSEQMEELPIINRNFTGLELDAPWRSGFQ